MYPLRTDSARGTWLEALERRCLLSAAPAGAQFLVNSFTTADQFAPAVASDSTGDFVIVWASDGQDGSDSGIFAQRYNASGAPQGTEFQVNTFTTGVQSLPAVAMDSTGEFVISWTSVPSDTMVQPAQDGSGAGVFARRYSAAGVALDASEFRVNTFTTGNQQASRVAIDSAGDFVIAWNSNAQDGSSYGVFAQRYNASGTPQGAEFQVNQFTTGLQADPSVAMDSSGDFVIAWTSGDLSTGQDGSFYGIYARRYDASGVAQAGEFQVNTYTTDYQTFASVAMDGTGDFVVAWNSYGQDGSQYGVYARRFNSAGTALDATEFRVNTFTAGQQSGPTIGIDANGDFTIAWSSADQDGSGRGVYAQSYDVQGNPIDAEFRVNTTTLNNQTRPAIAMNATGDFVIAWQDGSQATGVNGADGSGYGIYAQRYVASDQIPPTVTAATFNWLTSQSLSIRFSENVSASLSTADIVVQNLTNSTTVPTTSMSLSYDSSTNTATVTFGSILADGNYRVTLLSSGITDSAGNHLDGDNNGTPGGDYSFDFFVLAGDANHDRSVDVTDLGILATNWQQSGRNFSQGDFNYDGVVDVTDLGILATNWQKSVPAPSTPAVKLTTVVTSPSLAPASVARGTTGRRTSHRGLADELLS